MRDPASSASPLGPVLCFAGANSFATGTATIGIFFVTENLGAMVDRFRAGRLGGVLACKREPNLEALDRVRGSPGIREFEEMPLSLEEIYCALLGKRDIAA